MMHAGLQQETLSFYRTCWIMAAKFTFTLTPGLLGLPGPMRCFPGVESQPGEQKPAGLPTGTRGIACRDRSEMVRLEMKAARAALQEVQLLAGAERSSPAQAAAAMCGAGDPALLLANTAALLPEICAAIAAPTAASTETSKRS